MTLRSTEEPTNRKTIWKRLLLPVSWLIILLLLDLGISGVVVFWLWLPGELTVGYSAMTTKGAYGDTFGSVNALFTGIATLFTGLAFAGLIITLILQMKELGLQRKELRQQRQEFEGTRLALEDQSETLQLQRFENTFFQLLSSHLDGVSRLQRPHFGNKQSGYECIYGLVDELTGTLLNSFRERADQSPISDEEHIAVIDDSFEYLFKSSRPHLGHYFRQIYHLLKFIDDSRIVREKKFYADILQSHLGNKELVLIAYNGLSKHGPKLKDLVERYGLLENVEPGTLVLGEHAGLYEESAFGTKGYRHQED